MHEAEQSQSSSGGTPWPQTNKRTDRHAGQPEKKDHHLLRCLCQSVCVPVRAKSLSVSCSCTAAAAVVDLLVFLHSTDRQTGWDGISSDETAFARRLPSSRFHPDLLSLGWNPAHYDPHPPHRCPIILRLLMILCSLKILCVLCFWYIGRNLLWSWSGKRKIRVAQLMKPRDSLSSLLVLGLARN